MGLQGVETELATTRAFWDSSPCGGQETLEAREALRYQLEPYLPSLLDRIAGRHGEVVEIGCGQGTDGLYLCRRLAPGGRYLGIDYSENSVRQARAAAGEDSRPMTVAPRFEVGNAERLDLPDASTDCVYSMGVLHHTADVPAAVAEVRRILKPGGRAYVLLYRKWSPKVTVAKALRLLQAGLDRLLGTDRCLYRLIQGRHAERRLGTMLLECFGVPYMAWYGRAEMLALFADFRVLDLKPYSVNLPWLHKPRSGPAALGYLWLIEAEAA